MAAIMVENFATELLLIFAAFTIIRSVIWISDLFILVAQYVENQPCVELWTLLMYFGVSLFVLISSALYISGLYKGWRLTQIPYLAGITALLVDDMLNISVLLNESLTVFAVEVFAGFARVAVCSVCICLVVIRMLRLGRRETHSSEPPESMMSCLHHHARNSLSVNNASEPRDSVEMHWMPVPPPLPDIAELDDSRSDDEGRLPHPPHYDQLSLRPDLVYHNRHRDGGRWDSEDCPVMFLGLAVSPPAYDVAVVVPNTFMLDAAGRSETVSMSPPPPYSFVP